MAIQWTGLFANTGYSSANNKTQDDAVTGMQDTLYVTGPGYGAYEAVVRLYNSTGALVASVNVSGGGGALSAPPPVRFVDNGTVYSYSLEVIRGYIPTEDADGIVIRLVGGASKRYPSPMAVTPSGDVQFGGAVIASTGIDIYTDFTAIADGAIPSKHDELALPIRTYYPAAYGAVPYVVKDGRLQSESENTGLTVCYTETDLLGQASIIGADISYKSNGGAGGTCAVCLWGDSSLVDTYSKGRIPTTGCHFVIQRNTWSYQIWDIDGTGTSIVTLATGIAPNIPQDQTTFRVEIKFDADSAIISFPGLNWTKRITDARIRTLGRRYACWETYQSASTADKPQFARIWASSIRKAEMASRSEITLSQTKAVQSATTGSKTITETTETEAAEIDTATFIEFVFPASGKILLEYTALFNQTVAGTVIMDLALVDAGGGNLSYIPAQASNAVSNGLRTVSAVYTNAALAGAKRFYRPRAWVLSGAACTISRSPSGGLNPVLKVTPL